MRSCFRFSASMLFGVYRHYSRVRFSLSGVCRHHLPLPMSNWLRNPGLVLVVAPTLILLATQSVAQDTSTENSRPSQPTTTTLEQLQITAGKDDEGVTQTGDVVADEHTGSHTRIPYLRLEQPGSQLGNILSNTTGVQQRQSGGFGTFSSITVRASSAAQTAVYLDGILINSGGEPVVDLSTLEILNLSSVDLYRGSTPLQLGHAGIGGAVNLNTLRENTRDTSSTRLRLGLGSFGQASVSAAHFGRRDNLDWTASLSHQQSDNDFPFLSDNGTSLNTSDDRTENRRNNDVIRSALLLKGGYKASELTKTDILFQVTERDLAVPDRNNTLGNNARFDTTRSQLQLSHTIDEWRNWNTRHSLYWHQTDNLFDDRFSQIGLGRQLIDSDIRTLGAKSYWERFISAGTAGFSLDLRDETIDQQDVFNRVDDFKAQRQRFLATAHLAILDDKDRWMLTPAVRWQQSRQTRRSTSPEDSANLPTTDENDFGVQLGAALYATDQLTVTTNVGNYFREPSFGELFGSVGLIEGNSDLVPEEGINTDIGLQYALETIKLDATVFYNQRDELIATTFDARGIGRPQNLGKARVSGLELEAAWTPSAVWQFSANATFQNPRNLGSFGAFRNKTLPGQAKRTAFARVQYQPSSIAYWYEWTATRDRFFDSANIRPAENTSLHSVGFTWQHKRWQLSGNVQNIGDDFVEEFNGFAKPGRSFFISVTHEF